MSNDTSANLAEVAAQQALDRLYRCIDEEKSFLLEAGAGAGKTYSLISALRRLITQRGTHLIRNHQQIACITFTNVAKDEIDSRTDRHGAIRSDTVHGFCWSVLRNFQPHLRSVLSTFEKWKAPLEEVGGLSARRVEYDLGYMRIENEYVSIRHDDVLMLMTACLNIPKFRHLLTARYPIIFIDEYQDTDTSFVQAIKDNFLDTRQGPLIGFFGDHWQKIYGTTGCGKIEHNALEIIGKEANFRSVPAIVNCLNQMRPSLPQMVRNSSAKGEVRIFHTNAWVGDRLTSSHWKGDTPENIAHAYLELVIAKLKESGWDFNPEKTKILMLTHNVLAKEQGYSTIPQIFSNNDSFLKKEDPHIAFFTDILEPACDAYQAKRYGEMFAAFGRGMPTISSHNEKALWSKTMDELLVLRNVATVGSVIDHIRTSRLLRLPEAIENKERALATMSSMSDEAEPSHLRQLRELRAVSYREIIALDRYIDGHTPFATKHGVKGAEFDNVLVVLGRGWNQYNFDQMLAWAGKNGNIPNGKLDSFERNRNLFYVACSRPKSRLALLFTQFLSDQAIETLTDWFGTKAIESLPGNI